MKGATGHNCHPKPRKPQNPGFALVITLSLMVLLTIVAVGLLTLSTISLRGSTHDAAMATARANARLALMMAIGELQKQAGPDQRVTATADLAGTAAGDPLGGATPPLNNTTVTGATKGLSMVQPGTRYWTGVWQQTAATTQIYTRTPAPVLKGWMISGNGGLSTNNRLTPATTVASVSSTGEVSDSTKAVVLVGRKSAGSDNNRYVGAPLVDMADKKGEKTSGRHGWWVGDEGVKAKFNQVPGENPGGEMTYLSMGDRRAGWEAVDGFAAYPIPTSSGAGETVAKVITLPEGRLLDPTFGDGSDAPLQKSFHALTTDSRGLLVDNFNGGLRVDLTPYVRNGFPAEMGTTTIVPRSIATRMRAPTWNRLKEFSDQFKNMEGGGLTVKGASDLNVAVAPVIAELRFVFGVRAVPVQGDPNGFKLHPCVKLAVTLANPYPYPLKWNSALDLEVTNSQPSGTQGVDGGYQPASIYDAAQSPDPVGRPAFVPRNTSQPAALNNVIFRIGADQIPAGEAKAFTIGGPVFRPANNANRVTVDMRPVSPGTVRNFDNCMEQGHDAVNNLTNSLSMDMRESWTTTQITVELRTGSGATSLLRRIERFELDNAYYATTKRPIDATKARTMVRPFGIHYFRFQFSQPGADYRAILPNPSGVDPLGLRSSTLRSFADFNVQGKRFHKAITSYNPAPYFMQSVDTLDRLPYDQPGGDTGAAFSSDIVITPIAWGRSPSSGDTKKVVLFSPQEEFISLAQLQHADLTGDDTFASVGHQPGNAVGNSYATPFVKRSLTIQSRNNYTVTGQNSSSGFQTAAMNYYDLAYLLNASLWDSYYFSAMAPTGTPEPLNPALTKVKDSPDLNDPKLAAQYLAIDGAFNVNSTRKEAWKAIFAGSKHLKHKADTAANATDAIYPRSLEQTSASSSPPSGEREDSYAGFRRLTDAQLDALAEEMTRQVRMRGPFLSMSHFVNRAIVDINRDKVLGRSGAIQAALDEAGCNINNAGTKNIFSDVIVADDKLNLQANGSAPRGDLDGPRAMSYTETNPSEPVWATSSKDLNAGAMASILADRPMLTNPRFKTEQGWRSTGIPGWITQADILQVIGPALSTRSDTFRIRAYGEATDPQTGQPTARAWCEAIVQRVPEYIDQVDSTADTPNDLSSLVNKTFGRRFIAVSFKWLSKDEI